MAFSEPSTHDIVPVGIEDEPASGFVGDEDEPPTTAFKQSAMKETIDDSEEQLNHDMAGFSAGGESNSNSSNEQQAAVGDKDDNQDHTLPKKGPK